jgi:hypothetical protein
MGSTRRANVISDRGWLRDFEDPILLPDGRVVVTLMDAANCITKLPEAEHSAPEWQAAMIDVGGYARGTDDVCAYRCHEGSKPASRARVRFVAQGSSLGIGGNWQGTDVPTTARRRNESTFPRLIPPLWNCAPS